MKYRSHETDFSALAAELHGGEKSPPVVDEVDDDYDEWADYSARRD